MEKITKDSQFYKFCLYGFFKNLKLFVPFFLLFLKSKDISYAEIGFLYGLKEITRYIFEIPSGILADIWGRKRTLIFSFSIYIISFFVFYFSQQFGLLVVAMLFFALGDAFRSGTHKAMIFDYLAHHHWEHQKVSYYGATRSCSQKGSALSALIAAFLVWFSNNYADIFIYSVIPFVFDILLISSYPKYLNGTPKPIGMQLFIKSFRKHITALTNDIKEISNLRNYLNISSFTGYYKEMKDFLQIIIAAWAINISTNSSVVSLPSETLSTILIGIVFFILYLLTSQASRQSQWALTIFSKKTTALNSLFILGVSFGFLAGLFFQIQYFSISIILFSLIYLIENLRKPIGVAFIAEAFDKTAMATNLSVVSLFDSILASSTAFLIGWLADTIGLGYALSSISIFYFLIFQLFFRFRHR